MAKRRTAAATLDADLAALAAAYGVAVEYTDQIGRPTKVAAESVRAVLAALAALPGADVVVCAHRGLDAAADYRSLLSGGLVGREVLIDFRRIARADVPALPEDQLRWLSGVWAELDAWIDAGAEAPQAE